MDEIEWIIAIIVAGGLVLLILANKTNESGLIKDDYVDTDEVIKALNKFNLKTVEGRKNGFTEADVEKQLEESLKSIFVHVTRQRGIGGTNSKQIDLDVGRGRVGIELKLASDIIKESGNDRLLGQVMKYKTRQYSNNNLIVAVAGYGHHERQTAWTDLQEDLSSQKIKYVFLKADKEM